MSARNITRFVGVGLMLTWTLLSVPIDISVASADACADSEVVFARGTGEPAGLGGVGQAFVDSLRSQVPGRSVEVYAVNYPASDDYANSTLQGADDARAHVQQMVANCPNTRMVLGGYSQGAGVIDSTTDSMPPQVADHVAAVALFGNPSSTYASNLMGGHLATLSPLYRPKTIDLCVPDDIVCAEGGNMVAHLLYVPEMTNQAATFATSRLH